MRPELAVRYAGQRLPRYTSYPTAPRFGPHIGGREYGAWLTALGPAARGSLYLHVPYCRSMCWYCGCHTTITHRDEPVADYVGTLLREIELTAGHLAHPLPVEHVHFGGGTPTILRPHQFTAIMERLRDLFEVSADTEVAIEIDPRTLGDDMAAALGATGVNRASLGVQTFDQVVQEAIHRVQDFATVSTAVERLRECGVQNLNFDLIYGLPHQTTESCIDTVQQALLLKPRRFSVFGYAHVPAFKKHQRKIDTAALPGLAERWRQEKAIGDALVDAGYVRIGLDHFARPDDSMAKALAAGTLRRNFQGYTTDTSEALIGFGASAISRLPQGYVQNEVHLLRYAQTVRDGSLPAAKGYEMTPEDRLRADLIERIMCDFRVDISDVLDAHHSPAGALEDAHPALDQLAKDGLIRMSGSLIEVTESARPLVRAVAAAFDAYLGKTGRTHAPAV